MPIGEPAKMKGHGQIGLPVPLRERSKVRLYPRRGLLAAS